MRLLIGCLLLLTLAVTGWSGQTVYQCDFLPQQMKGWNIPKFAEVVKDGDRNIMKITVPASAAKQQSFAVTMIDLTPYRGKNLVFSGLAKAENVTKPNARYNGVKLMLHIKTADGEKWYNQNNLFGTFDWKEIGFTVPIPADATVGDLSLGLQDSSGTVSFAAVKAVVFDNNDLFPKLAIADDFKAEYSDRVKNMPTLRGVMSPSGAYKPQDLEDLAKWKANLIRWQIVRNWGQAGKDRDPVEYDKWIDSKIAELDQALVDAKRLGIKVIIDLHSPPGGRYADSNMAMNFEPQYADQFIAVWQRIARHFKGNPAIWAYDLINEPVQTKPAKIDYLALQLKAAEAIRAIDPEIPIIIESNIWDSPESYKYLQPLPLKDIIYQVHMYIPGSFTHQNVYTNWGVKADKMATVTYPGKIEGQDFNRDTLRKHLQPVIDFQKKYGVRVYAGEFSAARWAPGAAKYLDDCIAIFEENHWDWTYHAYREFHGWSVEHGSDPYDKQPVSQDTDRKKVLLRYFDLNRTP